MRWMAKEKIVDGGADQTDGRTRFFGSLTQLSPLLGAFPPIGQLKKLAAATPVNDSRLAQTKTQKEKKKEERGKIKMRSRQVKSKEMMMNRLQRD